jgi:hypothetical protein
MTFTAGNGCLFQEDVAGVGSDVWQWGVEVGPPAPGGLTDPEQADMAGALQLRE